MKTGTVHVGKHHVIVLLLHGVLPQTQAVVVAVLGCSGDLGQWALLK